MRLIDLFDTGMAKSNPKSSLNMQMQSYKFSRHTAGLDSQRTYTFPPDYQTAFKYLRARTKSKVVDRRRGQRIIPRKTPGSTGSGRLYIERAISTLSDDVSDLDGKLGSISGRVKL